MSKLRLLVTPECNRACEGCCNDNWELDKLPKIKNFSSFDEIMLTGGEPMLEPHKILDIIQAIAQDTKVRPLIFLYTAKSKPANELLLLSRFVDGVTLSLHTQIDVVSFKVLQKKMKDLPYHYWFGKSLRLNVVSTVNITGVDTDGWDVRTIEWVDPEECPLPENEIFGRWEC